MKSFSLLTLLFFALTACASTPRYVPQTMFPHGQITMTSKINNEFSTPLNKFIELEFFNDNKEWVEIDAFTLETSKEKPSEILTDQESINNWVELRAQEKIDGAGLGSSTASFGFALLGLGVAIAEIASGDYNSNASTAAFIASDSFAIAAAVEEETAARGVEQALRNAPLSSRILLPPGRSVTRWFVINTPDDDLPSSFFINYTARGRISGAQQPKYIELVNVAPPLSAQNTQKLKRPDRFTDCSALAQSLENLLRA